MGNKYIYIMIVLCVVYLRNCGATDYGGRCYFLLCWILGKVMYSCRRNVEHADSTAFIYH